MTVQVALKNWVRVPNAYTQYKAWNRCAPNLIWVGFSHLRKIYVRKRNLISCFSILCVYDACKIERVCNYISRVSEETRIIPPAPRKKIQQARDYLSCICKMSTIFRVLQYDIQYLHCALLALPYRYILYVYLPSLGAIYDQEKVVS